MATKVKKKSVFDTLNNINVNDFTEKKGRFTYLSWSDAITEVLKVYPETTWVVHEFDFPVNNQRQDEQGYYGSWIKQPYMETKSGCYVKVSVTIDNITRTQIHPVLDNRNQPVLSPNSFQINTSILRCLTKCLSLFGLGLYIYRGEDLPEEEKPNSISDTQYKYMLDLVKDKDETFKKMLTKAIKDKKINTNNFEQYVKQIQEKNKEKK
jgi:hypothetical protein|tara:strand:- start:577 stop:1203 length:627 start_codon:yes stop_codon:yes gene_type:complete